MGGSRLRTASGRFLFFFLCVLGCFFGFFVFFCVFWGGFWASVVMVFGGCWRF